MRQLAFLLQGLRWDEIEAMAREFAAAYQSASSDRP
jgi:hypothetical protein